jgi:hypothetical protein
MKSDRYLYAPPDDSLAEIAELLSRGVLRLQSRPSEADPPRVFPETALKTARQDLEQSRKTRLSVTRG